MAGKGISTPQTVIEAFSGQARRYPERLAIEADGQTWTYGDLLAQVDSLAATLVREAGGREHVRVAFFADHSAHAIATMLAVAWAGMTWVALDPQHPLDRLREVVVDADAYLIVAGAEHRTIATALADGARRILDANTPASGASVVPSTAPLAYLLYTSGSTGKPKGVIQSHTNLWWHIDTYITNLGISTSDHLSLLPSLSVDAALMDVFGALCSGASLHLRDLRHHDIDTLPAWLESRQISIYHSTPTIFRALVAALGGRTQLAEVRLVVLGGEAAYDSDFAGFERYFGAHAVLVNGLGPTESTIALQGFFRAGDQVEPGSLPVGEPVVGMEVLLLDHNGRQAVDCGELVLRSQALALGYWNAPELTCAAFLPDPADPSRRLYLTGDMARRLPDGRLVHYGRKDNQIKLRGHRIEPGDVETAIQRAAAVRAVAVIKAPLASGTDVLVAAIVEQPGCPLDAAGLRERLREALPAYMVPGVILVRDRIPLTVSGKINRLALADEIGIVDDGSDVAAEPLDATQAWLAEQWCELLAAGGVHRASDFFALGGHSLTVTRLLSRIAETFDVELAPAALFEHPTLAELAGLIDGARTMPAARVAFVNSASDGTVPLSLPQEQIWVSQQFAGDAPIYNVAHALELCGPLRVEALVSSLEVLMERHDALRLRVAIEQGVPVQTVAACGQPDFEYRSLAGAQQADAAGSARGYLEAARMRPFDLQAGNLLRVVVAQVATDFHYLLFVVHHIAADGISVRRLFDDWSELYDAAVAQREPTLPTLVRCYTDFVQSQRDWHTGPEYAELKDWWNRQLADLPPLHLPTDRPRLVLPSHRAAVHQFAIGREITRVVRDCVCAHGLTVYMYCLAALSLVLARYSRQCDFAIATPVANRVPAGVNDVVGTFVNTLLVRLRVDEERPVSEYLAEVRRVVVESLQRQRFPLAHLSAKLSTQRGHGGQSLFDVMLAVQSLPEVQFRAGHVASRPLRLGAGTVLGDVCLTINEDSAELRCELEYASELFDAATMASLAGHFVNTLRSLAKDPDLPLATVGMLAPDELRRLAHGVAGVARDYELATPIDERVRRAARAHPQRTALATDTTTLSYAQLVGAAERVAAELRALGAEPGRLIPVITSRGPAVVIAWLGVLMAGAGFVPIDSEWPRKRIEAALIRCGSRVIISERGITQWQAIADYRRVEVEGISATESEPVHAWTPPMRTAEQPVYGIFTSGSTGMPKLAVVAHGGLNNRFEWMSEMLTDGQPPVTLQTTTHIYDSAVWQLLWPLTCGGKVVIPSDRLAADSSELLTAIGEHGVTIVDFVPTVFDYVVEQLEARCGDHEALYNLHFVILGGEAIRPDAVSRFRQLAPGVGIVNLYGPTEATIGCISCIVNDLTAPYPIGRPIANTRALLLDDRGRLVPDGVVGEILLGGACVGLGYWRDADATARVFVDNPYAHFSEMGRLYRTGDLGRVRRDGLIDFLGRTDGEIKLRGVRIHPSEIESTLRQHSLINDAVVGVRSYGADLRLCAWLQPGVPADIREFCLERLPRSLIPELFSGHDRLPTLPGGKLDKNALLVPAVGCAEPVGPLAYASELEQRIARLWGNVLQQEVIDTERNFFDLGGTSLLAMRLHFLFEQEFGLRTSLVDLFRYPTIKTFAERFAPEV